MEVSGQDQSRAGNRVIVLNGDRVEGEAEVVEIGQTRGAAREDQGVSCAWAHMSLPVVAVAPKVICPESGPHRWVDAVLQNFKPELSRSPFNSEFAATINAAALNASEATERGVQFPEPHG